MYKKILKYSQLKRKKKVLCCNWKNNLFSFLFIYCLVHYFTYFAEHGIRQNSHYQVQPSNSQFSNVKGQAYKCNHNKHVVFDFMEISIRSTVKNSAWHETRGSLGPLSKKRSWDLISVNTMIFNDPTRPSF